MTIKDDSILCSLEDYKNGEIYFNSHKNTYAFNELMQAILSKSQFEKYCTGNDILFVISKKSEEFLKGEGLKQLKQKWNIK